MEDKKIFISYLDDDGKKKDVWVNGVDESLNYICFIYNSEKITIPYHRVLKIKKKREVE